MATKSAKEQAANKRHFILGGRLLLAVILAAGAGWAQRGVVVVSVSAYSEAANAGIEPGDTLLSWSRAGAEGLVKSPFDLTKVELEQAPLGTVTIEGLRSSQKLKWELGQEDWGISSRPDFAASTLALYLRSRSLTESGSLNDARVLWSTVASHGAQQGWIYSWWAGDTAEALSHKKNWRAVDALYREASTRAKSDPLARTFLLKSWATTFEERQDWDTVARLLQQSLTESEAYDPGGFVTASALSDSALLADWRFDFKTAGQLYRQALAIDQKLAPQSLATARTLIDLAKESLDQGDETLARAYLDETKPILDKFSPESYEAARFCYELGVLAKLQGGLNQAKQDFTQAKHILENRWPNSTAMIEALGLLSFISGRQGDLTNAEMLIDRALTLYKQNPEDPTLGLRLTNDVAMLAYRRGDFSNATKYELQTEATLAKLAPSSVGLAGCLINLGLEAFGRRDIKTAELYFLRAAGIVQKTAPQSIEHADALIALSWTVRDRGDLETAATYASRARQILLDLGPQGADMADALQAMGEVAERQGKLEDAERYIRQSIAVEQNSAAAISGYAESLADLAEIFEKERHPQLASKEYELAVDTLEGEMGRLGGNEAVRSGFREQHDAIYKKYIDVLIEQGDNEEAFKILERSRARTLLEMLAEGNIDIRAHVEPSLRDQEHALQKQFAAESDHRMRLLMGPHSDGELRASDTKIADLLAKFAQVESQIRDRNPGYAELTQSETTTIKDVQHELLDSDTLLLEYSLGKQRSYLWLMSSESASVYVLPQQKQIESAARAAYKELANLHTNLSESPSSTSSRGLEELSRMLLGPVEHQLGSKRLLVVADGSLNYIPFAALRIHDDSSGLKVPLVMKHEIINLPSASVLLTLRQEHQGRQEPPQAVAVLADPIFDSHDPRLGHTRSDERASDAVLRNEDVKAFETLRSIELTRTRWRDALGRNPGKPIYFPRLAYSRNEAQAIVAAAPAGESLEALDFNASRAEALDPILGKYKIVHFATHGLVDTAYPEFSGLVFSLYNRRGEAEIGLLSLADIYNLNLPVDMVVLSACETALGKEVKGEGLIGLTRGFMYAGAPRVVASLWNVNDRATAYLMGYFYRAIEQDHLPAAAALRKAQLEMQSSKRWANPYYWAGFELQGEWK